MLQAYCGLVDAPPSMASEKTNVWQTIDRRRWEDEVENAFATAEVYVEDPEYFRLREFYKLQDM